MTAADVVRRCQKEGIRLSRGTTPEGEATVDCTLADGRVLPNWLRDWALFNPTAHKAALLNLTEGEI